MRETEGDEESAEERPISVKDLGCERVCASTAEQSLIGVNIELIDLFGVRRLHSSRRCQRSWQAGITQSAIKYMYIHI